MSSEKDKSGVELSLAELAERSGTPGRTIRFYIARGLLAGPFKAGRGASYGEAHLARLAEIREWQEKGLTLTEIARRLTSGERMRPEMGRPQALLSYRLAPDVVVQVDAEASPWRLRQIERVLRDVARLLTDEEKEV
ncbi:MAG: MerR family transcriptional regulator [Acidobacteriota bacterium]|jgi:DNA-binding transcriptional MerR regulator